MVKNVGTPYTLFLGRNLYTIFMNAYSLVNNQVRRKLDEMLKTWKEPVPGSLDPRPVFPAETIRPIENALIKARTAAVQAQQQQQSRAQQEMMARSRPIATPNPQWRSTPTPPQARGPYHPPPQQMYNQQNIPNGNYQVYNTLRHFHLHAYLQASAGTSPVSSDSQLPSSSANYELPAALPTATATATTTNTVTGISQLSAASKQPRSYTSGCRQTDRRGKI